MRQTAFALGAIGIITLFSAGNAGAADAPVLLSGLSPFTSGDAGGSNAPLLVAQNPPTPGATPSASESGLSLPDITVIAKQLNQARINIEPAIGATKYTMGPAAIQNLPEGQNTPIDSAILQMPGVDQDNLANGGIHVRDEHLNVQYRIDGVIIPDGVSFFGQDLSLRFVQSMSLITGSLPAEYGLRTAGIIDIQSKNGLFNPGRSVEMYGGSYTTLNPNFEAGGVVDGYSYYATGDYYQSINGINDVTSKYYQIHDRTEQTHDFARIDKIIDANDRVSVFWGFFNGDFQIPNTPDQSTFPGITAVNNTPASAFSSSSLTEFQVEGSQFGAVSFLHTSSHFDFQVSDITKYSFLHYYPDLFGDLAFNGIGEDAGRTSLANNLQAEGTYRLAPNHTLRGGLLFTAEHVTSDTNAAVLDQIGTDSFGNPIYDTTPTYISASSAKTSFTYSAYLQDEWKALPKLTVNYGARFDVVNGYTMGSQLSPRLNMVWQATPTTTFHAGYARYFTPPPQELVATANLAPFANTTGAPASTENSPILNESANYLDIGVKQQAFTYLTAGLDAYYKFAHNLLDEGQFGAPIVLTPFNYKIGINKGVELTTDYTRGNFTFYGNLAIANQLAKGIEFGSIQLQPFRSRIGRWRACQHRSQPAQNCFQRGGVSVARHPV